MSQATRHLEEAFRQVAPSLMLDVLLFLGGKRVAGNPTGSDLVQSTPKTKTKPQALSRKKPETGASVGSGDGPPTSSGQWKTVNESMSDFSRAYQKQITGQEGMAWIQNGVKFDGMKDGVLLDAKGKYAQFINKNTGEFYGWFIGKESLLDEAARQIKASEGAKIQWYFAEKEACDVVQDLFMDKGITEIELIFQAPK